jgi:hypothetical protein
MIGHFKKKHSFFISIQRIGNGKGIDFEEIPRVLHHVCWNLGVDNHYCFHVAIKER